MDTTGYKINYYRGESGKSNVSNFTYKDEIDRNKRKNI